MRSRWPLAAALLAALLGVATGSVRPVAADSGVPPALGEAEPLPNGHYRVTLSDGHVLYTHGPDPMTPEATVALAAAERPPVCATDYHQHILYGYRNGQTNRYSTVKASIQAQVRRMNGLLDQEALASGDRHADYKVKCDGSGEIAVGVFSASGSDYSTVTNAARAAGYNQSNADYSIFFDGSQSGVCGVGSFYSDERLSVNNYNNNGGGYAISYASCWTGRTPMHENGHNQGAVQRNAPYSTGSGGHCNDAYDVMCYSPDGGDRNQGGVIYRCTDREYFDCGYDTYFDVAPESGEYLATNWNIGSTLNRFIAFGPLIGWPGASFASSCVHLDCSFTDTSTDDVGIVSWSWSFGDGATSTLQHPSHTYTAGGTYTVTLTAVDGDGNQDSESQTVTVIPDGPPATSFGAYCSGRACQFTDTSSDPGNGTIVGWSWTFGDGGTSSAQHPTHTYAADGTYTVSLTATDEGGFSSTASRTVTVPDPDPATPTLSSGVSRGDTSAPNGSWRYYKVNVPPGQGSLIVTLDVPPCPVLFFCNPELDLYVRSEAKPGTSAYDCRPGRLGADESCSMASPSSGYWYVGVRTSLGLVTTASYTITATYG